MTDGLLGGVLAAHTAADDALALETAERSLVVAYQRIDDLEAVLRKHARVHVGEHTLQRIGQSACDTCADLREVGILGDDDRVVDGAA